MPKKNKNVTLSEEPNLDEIILNLPGFVYWKNTKSEYMGCNWNLAKVSGLKHPSEICGKTDEDFHWGSKDAEVFKRHDQEIIETGTIKVSEDELPIKNADGYSMHIKTEKFPLRNKEGKIVGILGVAVEITELKRAQFALKEQIKKTEQAHHSQGVFVAKASHEIRNPMGAVSSLLKMTKEKLDFLRELFFNKVCPELNKHNQQDIIEEFNSILSDVKQDYHDVIENAEKSLKALKNLEELNFIELHGVNVNWTTDKVSNLVEEAISHSTYSNDKGIDIQVDIENSVPEEFECDFNNIRDALAILIGNAIRFSENNDFIKIKLIKAQDTHHPFLEIIVQDFGKGITKEQLNDLFHTELKDHYQVEVRFKKPSVQLKKAKLMVEASDGSLKIESVVKVGTIAKIKFPYRPVQFNTSLPQSQVKQLKEKSLKELLELVPHNILLVEDDAYNQDIIEKLLIELGCKEITTASTGSEAIKLALKNDFNIIFQDFTLPDINGMEVARQIFKSKGENTVIIGVTSHTSEEAEAHAYEQGIMDIIFKPVTKENLSRAMRAALLAIYNNL